MTRRSRLLSIVVTLAAGALILIASTQTWFTVALRDGSTSELPVAGADAVAVLAPLALAILALGAALSIAGRILAYVLGVLTTLAGIALAILLTPLLAGATTRAVASTVTEWTGLEGLDAIEGLISSTTTTPWPVITFAAALVVIAAGVYGLATAHGWAATGRRYRTAQDGDHGTRDTAADATPDLSSDAPIERDAIEAWDDLSHGDDPTR